MGRREIVMTMLTCITLLPLGVVCLFWPHGVRNYGLEKLAKGRAREFIPFLKWMQAHESQHVWSIRLSGAIALVMVILPLLAFIRGLR